MNGTYLEADTVTGEGSIQGGEGTRVEAGVSEDLEEVWWSVELHSDRKCEN